MATTAAVSVALPEVKLFDRWGFDDLEWTKRRCHPNWFCWCCKTSSSDISPLRGVNQALYLLTTGARESAFRNIKTIAESTYAIEKKDEIESELLSLQDNPLAPISSCGVKNLSDPRAIRLPSTCCYFINCNIPIRSFGFFVFIPRYAAALDAIIEHFFALLSEVCTEFKQ
ncbi:hypothetical protein OPV22_026845 [Ensete ventricosum]|uniref:Uncharacterized protein n=1 Tax=Ensete ventricosum TaxID=4639 RepID=A0AAV8Q287_ENSVE|nr:hypothetical protein OPV22_026845 [Ensete ventricosum]